MYLIFDKGLETQRAVEVDFFGENLTRGVLNATFNRRLAEAAAVPDLSVLRSNSTFATLEAVDGEVAVPVQGVYNTAQDMSAAYNAREGTYSTTIVLGYKEG